MEDLSTKDLRAQLVANGADVSKCFERSDLEELWKKVGTKSEDSPTAKEWVNVDHPTGDGKTEPAKPQQRNRRPAKRVESDFDFNSILMFLALFYMLFGNTIIRAVGDIMGGGSSSSASANGGDATEYDGNDDFVRGKVRELFTKEEFDNTLAYHSESTGLPVIVDFFSPSCGPCQMIAPHYKQMAQQFKGRAAFVKVNTNVNFQTASAYRVHSMPTFLFILNNKVESRFSGYNPTALHQSTVSALKLSDQKGYYFHADQKGVMHAGVISPHKLADFYKTHKPLAQKGNAAEEQAVSAEEDEEVGESGRAKTLAQLVALAHKYKGRVALLMRKLRRKYGATPTLDAVHGVEAFAETLPAKDEPGSEQGQGHESTADAAAAAAADTGAGAGAGARAGGPSKTSRGSASSSDKPYSKMSTSELRVVLSAVQAELSRRGGKKTDSGSDSDATDAPASASASASASAAELRAAAAQEEALAEADAALNAPPLTPAPAPTGEGEGGGGGGGGGGGVAGRYKVLIIGGGPAGLATALYAARAGLEPLVVAPSGGGQLLGKGVDVENYPGVVEVGVGAQSQRPTGKSLVRAMRRQAHAFNASLLNAHVTRVELEHGAKQQPFRVHVEVADLGAGGGGGGAGAGGMRTHVLEANSLVVATGANSRWLGVPGEESLKGGGVSACATCDGFLYKGRDVLVVGGGDTAMEDALVLARTSASVTVVHRRDGFRASRVLAQRVLDHPKIKVRWNAVVTEFVGEGQPGAQGPQLKGAKVRDVKTGETQLMPASAAFVAIGHDPSTRMFASQLKMDPQGYLVTQPGSTKTSVDGVFAAGDVADKEYRQAVTSAGTGAMAALDAERWLSENGVGV